MSLKFLKNHHHQLQVKRNKKEQNHRMNTLSTNQKNWKKETFNGVTHFWRIDKREVSRAKQSKKIPSHLMIKDIVLKTYREVQRMFCEIGDEFNLFNEFESTKIVTIFQIWFLLTRRKNIMLPTKLIYST